MNSSIITVDNTVRKTTFNTSNGCRVTYHNSSVYHRLCYAFFFLLRACQTQLRSDGGLKKTNETISTTHKKV